ncbi:MAG: hypothetical protein J6V54_00140 [Bacteroidales bacterium]|jgi:hypothetical protein|nr:hypothetical protein [Bacteroidales bacterium]
MKKSLLAIAVVHLLFTSCSLTYNNVQNKTFEDTPSGISMGAKRFNNHFQWYFYISHIINSIETNEIIIPSFTIHSLTFVNPKGDTIPYKLFYRPVMSSKANLGFVVHDKSNDKRDTIPYRYAHGNMNYLINDPVNVSFQDKSVEFIYVDTIHRSGFLAVNTIFDRRINSIKVCYDIEFNGERLKGESWYRRIIEITSYITGYPLFLNLY